MLKLEKSKYLNSIFQLNCTRYENSLSYKNDNYKKIYKFKPQHCFIKYVFFFLIEKIILKIQFFNQNMWKKLSKVYNFVLRSF